MTPPGIQAAQGCTTDLGRLSKTLGEAQAGKFPGVVLRSPVRWCNQQSASSSSFRTRKCKTRSPTSVELRVFICSRGGASELAIPQDPVGPRGEPAVATSSGPGRTRGVFDFIATAARRDLQFASLLALRLPRRARVLVDAVAESLSWIGPWVPADRETW
jgi:hypothetical protein